MVRQGLVLIALGVASVAACSDDARKNVGETCATNTDCADHVCHAGICVSRHPLGNGAPCQGSAYCKSLKCTGGACAPNDRADGTACLHTEECASKACKAGVCISPTPPDGSVEDRSTPDASVNMDSSTAPDQIAVADQRPQPVCVNTQLDPQHCGGCNKACTAGAFCVSGGCLGSCPAASFCAGTCVDLQRDEKNCGKCGAACPASQSCDLGACGCAPGQSLCGKECVNFQNDPKHCGDCNKACTGNASKCSGGTCVTSCPAGTTDCSGTCANLQTDSKHCGKCSTACPAGGTCVNGGCACRTGETDCS